MAASQAQRDSGLKTNASLVTPSNTLQRASQITGAKASARVEGHAKIGTSQVDSSEADDGKMKTAADLMSLFRDVSR